MPNIRTVFDTLINFHVRCMFCDIEYIPMSQADQLAAGLSTHFAINNWCSRQCMQEDQVKNIAIVRQREEREGQDE